MKSKKILVLIIIALIMILFANMMIIKSKTLSLSKMENEKEIVTEINNTDDKGKGILPIIIRIGISGVSIFCSLFLFTVNIFDLIINLVLIYFLFLKK